MSWSSAPGEARPATLDKAAVVPANRTRISVPAGRGSDPPAHRLDTLPRHRTEIVRTAALPTWIDAIRETFVALDITPADSSRFTGSMHARQLAHLMAADVTASAQTFDRTLLLASRNPLDLLQIGMVVAGEGQLTQDGRTCTLRPGDFAIYETARPFRWTLRPEWHVRVYTWPRTTVPLIESQSQQLTARRVTASSALGQLVSPMLSSLLTTDREVSSGGAIRLADQIAELAITAALEECQPDNPDSHARELYASMLRYIDAHLDDPDLAPQQISQAFFVSTRTLHRLFARFGATVAITIRTRRLESCRQAMLLPHNTHRSLTDIAARFGFIDLAVFSRAFTTAYGTSPSRYRELYK